MDTINETIPAAHKSGDASVEDKKVKKKPRRRERDRIEYSRYRDDALEFSYRFGGFAAHQLAELLELRYPQLVGDAEAKISPALRASYRVIESMKRSKLVKKVAVRRGHLAGADGRVTLEDFVYLSPVDGGRAAVWAGALCGVEKARDAREGYRRHQLPRRPEHASWRTDLVLLLLCSAREEGVEAPIEEAFGESFPGYPYWVAKPAKDKAGEDLAERKNGRSYYDPVIPDASVVLHGVRIDVEVERWTRTGSVRSKKGVVSKVERHAACWLRLYERAEEALVREWSVDIKTAYGKDRPWKSELDAYRAQLLWLGLPEGVAPLVIVMRLSGGKRKPVNRVVLGPLHSLHLPTGDLTEELPFVEPDYAGPLRVYNLRQGWKELKPFIDETRRKLAGSLYREELESALRRYVRALDRRDWNTSFVQLWGVLEALTGTSRDRYEVTEKRVLFLVLPSRRDFDRQILRHLTNYRNRTVHAGYETQDIETGRSG